MTPLQTDRLPKAFFLPTRHGPCFCLFHEPQGSTRRGSVLYLHPFAEELNTTRRIVAHQARNLARLGYGVLQIDLFGCGDSAGNFEDATWSAWLDTAQEAHQWLTDASPAPVWFWGLRAGTLVATALIHRLHESAQQLPHLLLWQPVANGQQILQQLLRIRDAGEWMGTRSGNNQIPAAQAWAQGQNVEIAGYTISSELATDLAKARLKPAVVVTQKTLMVCIEVTSHSTTVLSPSSEKTLDQWKEAGWQTQAQVVPGFAFWQNISAVDVPELRSATNTAMAFP